jgi:hypothetical protein
MTLHQGWAVTVGIGSKTASGSSTLGSLQDAVFKSSERRPLVRVSRLA